MSARPLWELFLAARDRLLASPQFQRWALQSPLLRPIARRRARVLFDLCAGFVYSQVLFACVQLRIFERLRKGPRSVESLAWEIQLTVPAMRTLLQAAAALDLVQWRRGGLCGLGAQGATLLGNPPLLPMIAHHDLLYADLSDPIALLRNPARTSHLGQYWAYARAPQPRAIADSEVGAYTELMSASQGLVAEEVLDAYPLGQHRRLLDVGGGEGTFAALAAARVPSLHVACFDLPAVAERARASFEASGLKDRANAAGGDFLTDPLPRGADVISLIRVLHDHDDESALQILRAARAALPVDGTVLIAEPMSGTPGGARVADAYFGFYLLAMGRGIPRSPEQLSRLLGAAGFTRPQERPTRLPMNVRVLVARCDGVKVT